MFKLKKYIKSIIKESLVDNDKEKGRIGLILHKFPVLKTALAKLLSKSFMYFIKDVKIVAPKPTTFEIKLINHLDFSLQYVFKAKNWIAKISGKKYNLSILSDSQRAMEAITNLLTLSPALQETNPNDQNGGENFQNDPGQTAFNDTFSGGGNFDEPVAPSSEISPDTEPLSLDNPDSQGNEQNDDVQPEEIAEGKKIKLKEFLSKIR